MCFVRFIRIVLGYTGQAIVYRQAAKPTLILMILHRWVMKCFQANTKLREHQGLNLGLQTFFSIETNIAKSSDLIKIAIHYKKDIMMIA